MFTKGDLVLLSIQNLRLKVPNQKLVPKFIDSFQILEIVGLLMYRLAFPEQYFCIYNVFSVSLLEPWTSRDKDDTDSLTMPDLEDDLEEWEIEEIRGKRQARDGTQYLVKWADWPVEYNQGLPIENMANAKDVIQIYEKKARKWSQEEKKARGSRNQQRNEESD